MPNTPTSSAYSVFGLQVSSELPLPELHESGGDGEPDVFVARESVPSQFEPGFSVSARGGVLDIPAVGRFRVQDGRRISVDAASDASESKLRLYLLGSAFGVILHQRGLLPLHANAVAVDGRAIAFLGHSGSGKSTMAAWFYDHGFAVLSDDVCAVSVGDFPLAYPGIPRLRLWPNAMEMSGRSLEENEAFFDGVDKYAVPTVTSGKLGALPLGAIYVLRRGASSASRLELDRLRGVEAVEALVSNTYRGAYVETLGHTQRHLKDCLRLATSVPIYGARRGWGYEHFAEQARQIEEHARAALRGR